MLLQTEKSNFVLVTIKDVEAHEPRSHWTLMKNCEVNNKHRNKNGKMKTIFIHLIFQAQYIPRWNINEAQEQNLCTWINAKIGS